MINRIECGEEKLMKERTIMIFPQFENIEQLENAYNDVKDCTETFITVVDTVIG